MERRLRVVRAGEAEGEAAVPSSLSLQRLQDLTLSHPSASPARTGSRAVRAPCRLERCLVTYLRGALETAGAAQMVRRYGARAVLEALKDVMERVEVLDGEATIERAAVKGLSHWDARAQVRRWEWRPRAELRSPGGYLRMLLREGYA